MKDKDIILNNVDRRENAFLSRVYLKMMGALALTAVVAFLVASSEAIMRFVVAKPTTLIILAIAQVLLVVYLSMRIEKMSTLAANLCFIGYAFFTGVTFSVIVTAYIGTYVIAKAFVSSAVVFGLASGYGALTKKSLKGWSSWILMSLVGIIIASVVNMFLGSSTLDLIISAVGVVIFTLVTAWDSQKLIDMNRSYGKSMTDEELSKISIMGALDLYLDFINIFIYFLRIFEKKN